MNGKGNSDDKQVIEQLQISNSKLLEEIVRLQERQRQMEDQKSFYSTSLVDDSFQSRNLN